jgi:hypothetical protein
MGKFPAIFFESAGKFSKKIKSAGKFSKFEILPAAHHVAMRYG